MDTLFKRDKLSLGIFRAQHTKPEEPWSGMDSIQLRRGGIITCPECGAYLLKAAKDLKTLNKIRLVDFELLVPGVAGNDLQRMRCPIDQAPFWRFGQVHTTQGWI